MAPERDLRPGAGRPALLDHPPGQEGSDRHAEDRISLVRLGYSRFNDKDVEGVLALCTDDVEWPDVVDNTVLHGIGEVRDYFTRIFAITTPLVTLGDVIEIGDAVLATVYQQFYDLVGRH